jgi:hypothetical protein
MILTGFLKVCIAPVALTGFILIMYFIFGRNDKQYIDKSNK